MRLARRSLFLKMFLWFWATVVATGIALILTFVLQRGSPPAPWRGMLADTARHSGTIVVAEMEKGGDSAASSYLEQLDREAHLQSCLFDGTGVAIAGAHCASFNDLAKRAATSKVAVFSMRYGVIRAAMTLTGSTGREYIFTTELPEGPRAAFRANRGSIALRWGVALLVSGFICYLLARYLTTPILQLRTASQQLARGELSVRAAARMEDRRDELGDLVRDFNTMADRIEELISNQRQLIYDVSHELRSPLARLNVALDLARERKGADAAFLHMEQDLERLSATIGRLLTLARLDTSSEPVEMTPVNLKELASQIVRDASFESRETAGGIHLAGETEYWVQGNAELLHSAIENVIRNAIRYTDAGTPVEVRLERKETVNAPLVRLTIRDHGPGVPDSELANIFRPFHRVDVARDRQSGGTGLGLAIADRVIRLHGGTIQAANTAHGLQVEISLPLSS
jgi:two-component system, OmpR family, sensor histidine kinase CpxA